MIRRFLFATVLTVAFPAMAEDIAVSVGQVSALTSDVTVGTVAVGDPKIADVAVEGKTVLVFGKAVGETDLVVFGEKGVLLFKHRVSVAAAQSRDSVIILGPGDKGVVEARWKCPPGGRCTKEVPGK